MQDHQLSGKQIGPSKQQLSQEFASKQVEAAKKQEEMAAKQKEVVAKEAKMEELKRKIAEAEASGDYGGKVAATLREELAVKETELAVTRTERDNAVEQLKKV